MSTETEVCVIGAGPAGSSLALRLAALGHDVTIVERHAFPRPHIGESLSPMAWPVLDALGVRERVRAAGFPPTLASRIRWAGGEQVRHATPVEAGVTVDRGAFDALLLDAAREAGATVMAPIHAGRPVAEGGGWRVPLREGAGAVRARVVADATGRLRLLGGRRARTSPATVALHATWSGGGNETRIEAMPEGWTWAAPLPDGGSRVMTFVDASLLRARGGRRGAGELYESLLAAGSLLRDRGRRTQPLQVCDATCFAGAATIDARSVRVGEAAFAIDPLSSAGVQTAIQSALAAATAVHTILAPDGDAEAAISFYADHQRHAVARHAQIAAAAYAERGGDEPFWRARAAPAPAAPAGAEPGLARRRLEALLPRPVRLSHEATLAPTPCVVGDRVERRRALTHPSLQRPVAFLGGHELALVVDALTDGPCLAAALASHPAAAPVAAWLAERHLLEPAP